MKKTFFLALAIVATITLSAQKPQNGPKQPNQKDQAKEWICKKQEQRRAYIISRMELSESEKAAFTAIYDTYRNSYDKSRGSMKSAQHHMNDSCSAAQYEKYLEIINNERFSQAKLDSDFYLSMKKTLSPRQIYLYYKADKDFNKLMMRDMHNKNMKSKK